LVVPAELVDVHLGSAKPDHRQGRPPGGNSIATAQCSLARLRRCRHPGAPRDVAPGGVVSLDAGEDRQAVMLVFYLDGCPACAWSSGRARPAVIARLAAPAPRSGPRDDRRRGAEQGHGYRAAWRPSRGGTLPGAVRAGRGDPVIGMTGRWRRSPAGAERPSRDGSGRRSRARRRPSGTSPSGERPRPCPPARGRYARHRPDRAGSCS